MKIEDLIDTHNSGNPALWDINDFSIITLIVLCVILAIYIIHTINIF